MKFVSCLAEFPFQRTSDTSDTMIGRAGLGTALESSHDLQLLILRPKGDMVAAATAGPAHSLSHGEVQLSAAVGVADGRLRSCPRKSPLGQCFLPAVGVASTH